MSKPTHDDAYSANPAENYERYFVPAIGRPVAEDLVRAAALRPRERVLDVACGTGIVTRLAAERVAPEGTVAGLDPNPGMLAVARKTVPAGTDIAWHEAPAESIPLPDESSDVVLCGMGLQFFSDRSAALREIRRVLDMGGRLVANLPGPTPPIFAAMAEALSRHVGPSAAGFVHAVFALHDPDEIRSLVTDAGFHDVEFRAAPRPLRLPLTADFLWQYVHSTPMAAALAQVDENRRAALTRDFAERCAPFVDKGSVAAEVTMSTVLAKG